VIKEKNPNCNGRPTSVYLIVSFLMREQKVVGHDGQSHRVNAGCSTRQNVGGTEAGVTEGERVRERRPSRN